MEMIFQLQVHGFGNPVIQQAPYVMAPRKSVSISIRLILTVLFDFRVKRGCHFKSNFPEETEGSFSPSRSNYKKGVLGCQEILLLIITIYYKFI